MVHTYKCLGKNFVLDVESGSVFVVDDLTANLIEKRSPSATDAKGDFSSDYKQEEIDEANAEIDELISEGVLFVPGHAHKEPVYKGIVKALCLNISHGCNLRSRYCFACDGQ